MVTGLDNADDLVAPLHHGLQTAGDVAAALNLDERPLMHLPYAPGPDFQKLSDKKVVEDKSFCI